jgi:hypothetical protein
MNLSTNAASQRIQDQDKVIGLSMWLASQLVFSIFPSTFPTKGQINHTLGTISELLDCGFTPCIALLRVITSQTVKTIANTMGSDEMFSLVDAAERAIW